VTAKEENKIKEKNLVDFCSRVLAKLYGTFDSLASLSRNFGCYLRLLSFFDEEKNKRRGIYSW
jgi:hypothetical protein